MAISCTSITDATWDRWREAASTNTRDSIVAEASDPYDFLFTVSSLVVPLFIPFSLRIYFGFLGHCFLRLVIFVFVVLNLLLHLLILVEQKPEHFVQLLVG